MWNICLCLSVIVLLGAFFWALTERKGYRHGQLLTSFNVVFIGVFLAVFIAMLPVFREMTEKTGEQIMLSLVQTLQVFTINVDAGFILDNISSDGIGSSLYSLYMSFLFCVGPVLTFGVIISFFKNVMAGMFYVLHYFHDVYVFSRLNEKTLYLAKDLKTHHPRSLIVFTDVDRDEGNVVSEDLESARELRALIFEKDIVTVDFFRHSKKAELTFFAMSENESENVTQGLKLLNLYKDRDHTGLYVFSSGTDGELLFSNADKGKVHLRRVNEVRSLIYHYLYDEGTSLFDNAVENGENTKEITALVLGLGKYGTEMTKALAWYGQMDGYTIKIHVFDKDAEAEDRFRGSCPDLMNEMYNGVNKEGQESYCIKIHSGMDVDGASFVREIASIPNVTFVFAALGDDGKNIEMAAKMRMLSERNAWKPQIKTVVYAAEEAQALKEICNRSGQAYDIESIGDLESSTSEAVLMGSELERLALERHIKVREEEEFWRYEYFYRSSMASAIHMKARLACGISGEEKDPDSLTEKEIEDIARLEHRRWNTYLRSEGYIFSGTTDKASRNDLAKMHPDLVSYDDLPKEEKQKDTMVGTR